MNVDDEEPDQVERGYGQDEDSDEDDKGDEDEDEEIVSACSTCIFQLRVPSRQSEGLRLPTSRWDSQCT